MRIRAPAGGHNQQSGRPKRQTLCFRLHFAATSEQHQQLMQVTVGVWLDSPIVDAAAIRDGFDVYKALFSIPRRLPVQEKTRNQCLRLSHCTKSKRNAFASMACHVAMDTV